MSAQKRTRLFKRSADIAGHVFIRLTAVSQHGKNKSGNVIWECLCACGRKSFATATALRRGRRVSCGCLQREAQLQSVTTHGMSYSGTYKSWASMISRCHNPKSPDYKRYGGRGISVCQEWRKSFEQLLHDMGPRPPLKTIGRRDNNGNYEPSNCRWESRSEQSHNRSNTVLLTWNGEAMPLSVLARRSGVSADTISKRLKRGFTVEEAITGLKA